MGFHTASYFAFAIAQAILAIWAFRLWRKEKTLGALALLLPIATVWYDNLTIALGSYIGPGQLLEVLTFPRFLGHSLFTPLWIVAAVHLVSLTGAWGAKRRAVEMGSYVLYGAMVVIGLLNEVIFFRGELATEGDVLFITNVGRLLTPPPPSLTMLLVVLICGGIILWRSTARWPWMLLSALVVLVSQGVRGGDAAFLFINTGEVLMSAALIAALVWARKRRDLAAASGA